VTVTSGLASTEVLPVGGLMVMTEEVRVSTDGGDIDGPKLGFSGDAEANFVGLAVSSGLTGGGVSGGFGGDRLW
jgi:hypothetical protein